MFMPRSLASLVSAATVALAFAGASLVSQVAQADVSPRVADIAAKGTIRPIVPVEAGLGLGLAAALLALGMDRRRAR